MLVAHQKNVPYLVIIDCDTTYPVESIPDLLPFLPEYDLIVGTRNFDAISPSHRLGQRPFTPNLPTSFLESELTISTQV